MNYCINMTNMMDDLEVPKDAIKLRLTVGILDEKILREIELDVQRTQTCMTANLKLLLKLYATYFPCDGYVQGMNLCAVPFVENMRLMQAFWSFVMLMGHIRPSLPNNYAAFHAFAYRWENMYHLFCSQYADSNHVLALKAGVFRLAPCMEKEDLCLVWCEMAKHDHDVFTAAFAAAAVRRRIRKVGAENFESTDAAMLKITNVEPLIRRAVRTVMIYNL